MNRFIQDDIGNFVTLPEQKTPLIEQENLLYGS